LKPGAQVSGSVPGAAALYVYNFDYASSSAGVTGISLASGGAGIWGQSYDISGYAVRATNNSGGRAVYAEGAINSTADSTLVLSPHGMVKRGNFPDIDVIPLDNGGVEIYNNSGDQEGYFSIPVSTFGTLLGSTMYIKAIDVCYASTMAIETYIDATSVSKNDGGTSWVNYIYDTTHRGNTTRSCYHLSASTPLKPIDESTWVQFNILCHYSEPMYIYTVKLTLSE
jgi:hypothetical protein